jgi:N-acetylmuramoyl-L-alanine amidase
MFKIILDAGHGKHTPGKRSPDGMREFYFNGVVAKYMREELLNYEGVAVKFSHDPSGESDVPRMERCDIANDWDADVFFSIHANAFRGVMGNHGGIETWVDSSRPDEATKLAKEVNDALVSVSGLDDRGVKFNNLDVVHFTKMTAVLVEHGFMDSGTDLPKLKSDEYRRLVAKTNVNSLATFYNLKKKPEPKPVPKKKKGLYKIQAGAFANREGAELISKQMEKDGYPNFIIFEEDK